MRNDWKPIADAASAEAARFAAALKAPRAAQIELLHQILNANAGSPFGTAHGFAAIRTLEDFRAAVPIAEYARFAPAIAATARTGRPQLTAQAPIAFERTGGSGGGSKLIPYTSAALAAFRRAVLPWLHGVLERVPEAAGGRFYTTISPATRQPEVTPGGIPVGLVSDATYLGEDLMGSFATLSAVPPEVGLIGDPGEWQVATLAALVEAVDISFVSLWSPTFLLALVEALARRTDDVAARVSPAARKRLDRAIAGGGIATDVLWPSLACISCWIDGASRGFADQLARRFPSAVIDPKGVLATEAPITLTWGKHGHHVPALTSCVIEFIDDADNALLCDELREGDTYRAVITTPGGLYRYDIGDRFACRGMVGGVPDLAFLGRGGLTVDLVGEKLDDGFVVGVLARLGRPALLAPRGDGTGYELMVEGEAIEDGKLAEVEAGLDANPQYRYARRVGQLAPLSQRTSRDLSGDLIKHGLAAGRRMGDVKPSGLLARPFDEESYL